MKEQRPFGSIIYMYFFNSVFFRSSLFLGVLKFLRDSPQPHSHTITTSGVFLCPSHTQTHWRKSTTSIRAVHYPDRKTGRCFFIMTSKSSGCFTGWPRAESFLFSEMGSPPWYTTPTFPEKWQVCLCLQCSRKLLKGAQRACVPAVTGHSDEH